MIDPLEQVLAAARRHAPSPHLDRRIDALLQARNRRWRPLLAVTAIAVIVTASFVLPSSYHADDKPRQEQAKVRPAAPSADEMGKFLLGDSTREQLGFTETRIVVIQYVDANTSDKRTEEPKS